MLAIFEIICKLIKSYNQNNFKFVCLCSLNFLLGESGIAKSKFCTIPANLCFGSSGQAVYVSFNNPFSAPPKVTIGLTLIDTDKNQNVRVQVVAESITTHEFFLRFKSWDVSITYQLHVN